MYSGKSSSEDPSSSSSQVNPVKVNWMSAPEKETFNTLTTTQTSEIPPCSNGKSNRWRRTMRAAAKNSNKDKQEDIPSLRRFCSEQSALEVIREESDESASEHTDVEPFYTSIRRQVSNETCSLESTSGSIKEADALAEPKVEAAQSKQDLTANRSSELCRVCKINEEYDLRRSECKSRPMSDTIYPKVLIIEKNGKIHNDFDNFENDLYLPLNESKDEQSIHSKMPKENMRNSEQPTLTEPDEHSRHISSEYTVEMELETKSSKNQQLKAKNGQKQRQLELHQFKIAVEQKRLELLDLKLRRERDEMVRDQILFEKDVEIKEKQLEQVTEEKKIN